MERSMLSTQEQPKRFAEVHGKKMTYVEEGSGPPIVFLHGNPTSSYIWRNILPVVAPHARCIAPDLIGMGDSEKVEGSNPARYGFVEHRRFLEALLERLGITENAVLVGHDWGGALAIDWARRHTRNRSEASATSKRRSGLGSGARSAPPNARSSNGCARPKGSK
jgi:haloalkane dehalogenase